MIDLKEIKSVYSGKDGSCCCGCSGKHYYASEHREQASKKRGYEVKDDEVSDRMVKRVVNKMNAIQIEKLCELGQLRNPGMVYDCGDLFSLVVGKRLYIAYKV